MTSRLVEVYDTTLRDGAQGEGVNFSVGDKCRVAEHFDGTMRNEQRRVASATPERPVSVQPSPTRRGDVHFKHKPALKGRAKLIRPLRGEK